MIPTPFRLLSRAHNLFWELRLGISTNGIVETNFPDAHHYSTLPYATVFQILDHLCLGPDDVLVDIGSGKGRVLCCAARYRVHEVIGVEVVPQLCDIAERNSLRMRGKQSPIVICNTRAQSYDYAKATVLTFFNPFGAMTLAAVLDRMEKSLLEHPRPLRLAYANPEHEHVIAQRAWLKRQDVWPKEARGIEHAVVFYRSTKGF